MAKPKKTFELNFVTVLIFIIIVGIIVFVVGRFSGNAKTGENQDEEISNTEQSAEQVQSNI